jgi:hypothetical protein
MTRHKIAENLAKFYLRYGRGAGLTNFVKEMLKNVVFLGAFGYLLKDWFGIEVTKTILISSAVIYSFLCYLIGWIDEKLGFWRIENSYASKQLNPFFEELDRKIDEALKIK